MSALRKVMLLSVAAVTITVMGASSASAVEVVRESDSAQCTGKICRVEVHDVGAATFHDIFNLFRGTCDIEMEGSVTHAGVLTASTVTITSCTETQLAPCGTWQIVLTSTTAADGQFCFMVGSQPYSCKLTNIVVSESGHNYTMADNSSTGEQACSNGSQFANFTLALEYDLGAHPAVEIR